MAVYCQWGPLGAVLSGGLPAAGLVNRTVSQRSTIRLQNKCTDYIGTSLVRLRRDGDLHVGSKPGPEPGNGPHLSTHEGGFYLNYCGNGKNF